MKKGIWNRRVLAWAFYDWANSAFALSVLAVLFPLFLGAYWSAGDPEAAVTSRLAWVNAAASAVICLLAPVFGSIADAGGFRKRFLFTLAILGSVATALLGAVGEGGWLLACSLFLLASLGYYGSTIFYDSLIVDVTEPRNYSFVSSLGFSIGYLGGAVLLALHVLMLTDPAAFGFESATEVIRFAFVTVGIWWAGFALPLLFLVHERTPEVAVSGYAVVRRAYQELHSTMRRIGQYRNVVMFLLAYCLYIGGVFTVISMAVNYGQRLGFAQQDLVTAFLVTNFAGFPATLLYGLLGQKLGPKAGIHLAIAVYIVTAGLAVFMSEVWHFYAMAIVIGCVQGGVQSLSRSLYAALIPPQQSGEFFGFYNTLTKFAHVIGLSLVGITTSLSTTPTAMLFTLLPLFIVGGLLLIPVRERPAAA
ncbi:MAG: MFS transporter [Pseudomonadota bacterium]